MEQKNERKSNKKWFVLLLLLLLVVTAGGVFAYWASTLNVDQAPNEEDGVQVGEGEEVDTVVAVLAEADDRELVPAGFIVNANQTDKLVYTYEVSWTGEAGATGAIGILTVALDRTAVHALVNFNVIYDTNIIANGDKVVVTVEVTITEPANQFEYAGVVDTLYDFVVAFNVTPAV